MNQLLKTGQNIHSNLLKKNFKVKRFLGGGGQGEVYEVENGNDSFALKWYFRHTATPEQKKILETLIDKGAPSERFLWPLELITDNEINGFGYLMPLRQPRFKSLFNLMNRTIEPSFNALLTTAIELPHNFYQLHANGLCYGDISFGNVFFDPQTGEILICDNDNVVADGTPISMLGTPDFMAPEIVRGENKPSIATDRFSLSVLLFYLLHVHHPLYGKKLLRIHSLDLKAKNRLCGTEPIFIFDPNDNSNEAVSRDVDPLGEAGANALACWPVYPQFVRDAFIQAFTDGIHDPESRIVETVWRKIMLRARDAIVYCQHCSAENFYDREKIKYLPDKKPSCWSCGKQFQLPPRLKIDNQMIMMNHDAKLYPHHISVITTYDFSIAIAEVVRHPKNPNRWGLKNKSSEKWTYILPDGNMRDVEPEKTVPFASGTKIQFGGIEGEIRV